MIESELNKLWGEVYHCDSDKKYQQWRYFEQNEFLRPTQGMVFAMYKDVVIKIT